MASQASIPSAIPKRSSRWRKLKITLLAVGLGVVCGLLAGEILLRTILFDPTLRVGGLGWKIRQPMRYSNSDNEDDYWKLACKLQGPSAFDDAPVPDSVLGWTGTFILPGTYAHIAEPSLQGRRPVLLYGDSFAQGVMPLKDCFQSILQRSEFAERYAMLNYGVGGYGLDQVYLMLENSLDRFKELDPIVIVGILIEGDLDRSILEFRCWPKPRLDVVGDRLVARGPVQTNIQEYLDQHPLSIRSYLWRMFLYAPIEFLAGPRERWRQKASLQEEKQRLNRRILLEIEKTLSSRHLQHFFLLFHDESGALAPAESFQWQEKLVRDVCDELKAPLIDTREFLSFASDAQREKCARFYLQAGLVAGHHNAIGNMVCFEAIAQGLRGNFAKPDMGPLADLKARGVLDKSGPDTESTMLLGRVASLTTHGSFGRSFALETSNPARLLLRGDTLGSTTARFELSGSAKRFSGRLHMMVDPGQECADSELRLSVKLDGELSLVHVVPATASAVTLDIDLADKQSLEFVVEGARGAGNCNWVCIENPLLE